MSVGIIVEGLDDIGVYRVLIKRIDPQVTWVHARECGGRRRLKNKFVAILKVFAGNPEAFRIEKVLVIRDSDCNAPDPLEGELRGILDASGFRPGFDVFFHATKCSVESWLLADEAAINSVSRQRGGRAGLAPSEIDLEATRDADELYVKTLSQVGLQNTAEVMKEIAEQANLETIARRCRRFGDFRRKVTDG